MGRPKVPESQKLRSFTVRLAPRRVMRLVAIIARYMDTTQQQVLRDIIGPQVDQMYNALRHIHKLPYLSAVSTMSEVEFEKVLMGTKTDKPAKPAKQQGPYLERREDGGWWVSSLPPGQKRMSVSLPRYISGVLKAHQLGRLSDETANCRIDCVLKQTGLTWAEVSQNMH